MLLGDAVMLFHRKMRHYKKYRALTDTDPLVIYKTLGRKEPELILLAYPVAPMR